MEVFDFEQFCTESTLKTPAKSARSTATDSKWQSRVTHQYVTDLSTPSKSQRKKKENVLDLTKKRPKI
jgi:hypothetical protein